MIKTIVASGTSLVLLLTTLSSGQELSRAINTNWMLPLTDPVVVSDLGISTEQLTRIKNEMSKLAGLKSKAKQELVKQVAAKTAGMDDVDKLEIAKWFESEMSALQEDNQNDQFKVLSNQLNPNQLAQLQNLKFGAP